MKHLLYLSPVPWQSFEQRPHHFVSWFQEKYKSKVTWIDPYPTRLPRFSDWSRLKKKTTSEGLRSLKPNFQLISVRALPVEPLPGFNRINSYFFRSWLNQLKSILGNDEVIVVIGKPSKLALEVLRHIPHIHSLYDAMDDFPQFNHGLSRKAMSNTESILVQKVNRVWASSSLLQKKFHDFSDKVFLVKNACTSEKFSLPEKRQCHEAPTLGYVGTIADWFDWDVVLKIAKLLPQAKVFIVGPIHTRHIPMCPKNIIFMGECSIDEAIAYVQSFDVGLIPFRVTELTESVDPIKYYEYRSAGIPVLSTSFGEMRKHTEDPGVFLTSEGALNDVLGRCLAFKELPEKTMEFRRENSWQARFDGAQH